MTSGESTRRPYRLVPNRRHRPWTDQTGPPGSVPVPESEWGAALFFGTLLLCCLGLLGVVVMLVGSVIFHAVT